MKTLSPKELYCYTRAAELQEQYHGQWSKCYKKAEEEYNNLSNLTTLPDYDDDVSDLEGYIE